MLILGKIIKECNLANWLTAIGTIMLAIVAVFQKQIWHMVNRPKFEVSLLLAPPDCHKTFFSNLVNGQVLHDVYYFRLKIKNIGNDTARNVEVFAASLKKKRADNKYETVADFLPMNIVWSHLLTMYFPSISSKMYKHCDLGHISKLEYAGKIKFAFDQIVKPNNMGHLIGDGNYLLEILVSAENAEPQKFNIEINFPGKWYDNEEIMLRDGIGINVLKK